MSKREVRGHFGLVYGRNVPNNTTVTTRRKSNARTKEAEKRAKLIGEMEVLTRSTIDPYARSYDGTVRRYNGIRGHGPDG